MTSRLERLPGELLDRICRNFDGSCARAMHNLCLASKACDTVTRRYLYRKPNLVGVSIICFAEAILQNERLAQSVEAIHITVTDLENNMDLDIGDFFKLRAYAWESGNYTLAHLALINAGNARRNWAFCYGLVTDLLLVHLRDAIEISISWQCREYVSLLNGTGRYGNARDLLPKLKHLSYNGHGKACLHPRGRLEALVNLLNRCTPQNLRAEGIAQFNVHWSVRHQFDSIHSIDLVNCRRLGAWDLLVLVRSCPNLKRFTFRTEPTTEYHDDESDVLTGDQVVKALQSASHRLQCLSLSTSRVEAVQTLQNFATLEHLRVSGADLAQESEYEDTRNCTTFVEKLPSSLRSLHICDLDLVSFSISWELARLRIARKSLPNLETIILAGDTRTSYVCQREEFEAIGIKYVVRG